MSKEYDLKVLFDGYSRVVEGGMEANCTCTLLKGPKNIIIDTMTSWDNEILERALRDNQLTCDDIDYVVCTHGHSDHIGCNYLFKKAIHVVGFSISKRHFYFDHDFGEKDFVIDDKVKVIATPGHTLQDVSVIADIDNVIYAITGDLFEKEEDLVDSSIWKSAGSDNCQLQEANREKILKIASYIIPGHGPMFKNKFFND